MISQYLCIIFVFLFFSVSLIIKANGNNNITKIWISNQKRTWRWASWCGECESCTSFTIAKCGKCWTSPVELSFAQSKVMRLNKLLTRNNLLLVKVMLFLHFNDIGTITRASEPLEKSNPPIKYYNDVSFFLSNLNIAGYFCFSKEGYG